MPDYADEQIDLRTNGFCVLKQVFDIEHISRMRSAILDNRHLMRNTRPSPSAGHLAGFHRYPALEPLHFAITQNAVINDFMTAVFAGRDVITIGLSDITINRSQHWHTDLLRGPYRHYLDEIAYWEGEGQCYKALVYLQAGHSLRVAPGSHKSKTCLDKDADCRPGKERARLSVPVETGDVVIMDIRLVHRGATEQEIVAQPADEDKILISTVFGGQGLALTRQMQIGNSHRLMDWEDRNPL